MRGYSSWRVTLCPISHCHPVCGNTTYAGFALGTRTFIDSHFSKSLIRCLGPEVVCKRRFRNGQEGQSAPKRLSKLILKRSRARKLWQPRLRGHHRTRYVYFVFRVLGKRATRYVWVFLARRTSAATSLVNPRTVLLTRNFLNSKGSSLHGTQGPN